jgi:hypothetical protein
MTKRKEQIVYQNSNQEIKFEASTNFEAMESQKNLSLVYLKPQMPELKAHL